MYARRAVRVRSLPRVHGVEVRLAPPRVHEARIEWRARVVRGREEGVGRVGGIS